MAITTTNPNTSASARAHAFGDRIKQQIMDWSALSGATSGTVTADAMGTLLHVLVLGGQLNHSAAPTYATNVATLAFVVPAETAATLVTQGLTLTAVAQQGAGGNNITFTVIGGAVAGSEVITVVGTAITAKISDGVSTITQVRTAMQAAAACTALVTTTGTSASAVAVASVLPLTGGITGGARGTLIALGY